ncbi:hypothetical protein [Parapedobacter lycopersici]|uniref:hypothetical protein n=1 Tax=Parapedobacter lycopersici TaxID=1864939 RepID=UPI00214D4703|nr:hypothetical protein [Parapedobacter lycopersici]
MLYTKSHYLPLWCLYAALSFFAFPIYAQSVEIPRGTSLYIVQHSDSQLKDSVPDLREALKEGLEDWGYFTIATSPEEAELTLDVYVDYVKEGMMTSFSVFNRRAAVVEAVLHDASKQERWRCEPFQVGEKGMIGYNFGKAAMKTLVKRMKKAIN